MGPASTPHRRDALRRLREPVDIANACLYLACDESSFVTGEIIFPDRSLCAAVRSLTQHLSGFSPTSPVPAAGSGPTC